MKRREFIALVGCGVVALPHGMRAQQVMPVVGYLSARSASSETHLLGAFRQGLKEAGFGESDNVVIEFRWAEGQHDQLPQLANDLVQRRVAIIVATGGLASVLAAKSASTTIPIVFTTGNDPVGHGLVESLNHPGGNATGVHMFLTGLEAKKLGLLHDLIPQKTAIAAMINPNSPDAVTQMRDLRAAADIIGQQVEVLSVASDSDLDAASSRIVQMRPGALLVGADPFFLTRRNAIVALAARQAIPAIYELREFPVAGGLMSYGTSISDGYRQVGILAAKILKGEKPANLPVMQATKFELVINLKTAKTLGLIIPSGMLAIADEVIE